MKPKRVGFRAVGLAVAFLLASSSLIAQASAVVDPSHAPSLSEDFGERAMVYVRALAEFGVRRAGTSTEEFALEYIADLLQGAGLGVKLEPFQFEQFRLSEAILDIGGSSFTPIRIGVDPYSGLVPIEGSVVLIDPRSEGAAPEIPRGAIIVTKEGSDYFQLAFRGARAIVYVSESDFHSLQDAEAPSGVLHVRGEMEVLQSANLVVTPSWAGTGDDVLITAHVDSKGGPGADDNASGVAVLMVLAMEAEQAGPSVLPNLSFVVFGAEELGVLGSRAYLRNHQTELAHCQFVFNMDGVGGSENLLVELLPGSIPAPSELRFDGLPEHLLGAAWEGPNSEWLLESPVLREIFSVSNVPDWLKVRVQVAAETAGLAFLPRGPMGADQQVFAHAGIPATSIAVAGNARHHHTAEDRPDRVDSDGLSRAGHLVWEVLRERPQRH